MKTLAKLLLVGLALTSSAPLVAYTVYLKDGSRLITQAPPEIRDGMAILTLQNGTEASIAAAEIDLDRTREANQSDLGSALVLEGGEFTDRPTEAPSARNERRLTDLSRSNPAGATGAGRSRSSGAARRPAASAPSRQEDLVDWQRTRYRNLDIASEILGIFRGQGVDGAKLFQGTRDSRILVDLTTDSEAAAFRAIRVAAAVLTQLERSFPKEVSALELVMLTSGRTRAGQFLIDSEAARQLLDGATDISTFYVENVRF
jgi:hypothetical protein